MELSPYSCLYHVIELFSYIQSAQDRANGVPLPLPWFRTGAFYCNIEKAARLTAFDPFSFAGGVLTFQ